MVGANYCRTHAVGRGCDANILRGVPGTSLTGLWGQAFLPLDDVLADAGIDARPPAIILAGCFAPGILQRSDGSSFNTVFAPTITASTLPRSRWT